MTTELQPGTPEADAACAQVMGFPSDFTRNCRWVGPMLLRLGELVRAMEWSLSMYALYDGMWEVFAAPIGDSHYQASGRVVRKGPLHETVWRCLLVCAERGKEENNARSH